MKQPLNLTEEELNIKIAELQNANKQLDVSIALVKQIADEMRARGLVVNVNTRNNRSE
jgi:ABC-type enterochelin transport system substrate-binding protein